MAEERVWIGADPGGKNSFGLAILSDGGAVSTACVSCASEALKWIDVEPAGVGIDAPMWWSAGTSGDRQADQWIRSEYSISGGTVQAANSLRGAALIQGALFAESLRQRYPGVRITEAHPKAVLLALQCSAADFFARFGFNITIGNEHERDALIAAIAAREGFSGRWSRDLVLERLEDR